MKRTQVGENPIDTCTLRDHVRNKENWSAFGLLMDAVGSRIRYHIEYYLALTVLGYAKDNPEPDYAKRLP